MVSVKCIQSGPRKLRAAQMHFPGEPMKWLCMLWLCMAASAIWGQTCQRMPLRPSPLWQNTMPKALAFLPVAVFTEVFQSDAQPKPGVRISLHVEVWMHASMCATSLAGCS